MVVFIALHHASIGSQLATTGCAQSNVAMTGLLKSETTEGRTT